MPRGRQVPPAPKGRSKEQLFAAETSITSTDDAEERATRAKKQKGERVEAPSAELLSQVKRDWGKIGVFVTLGLAAVAGVYTFSDLSTLARNTADDVKDLKRKADDLLRSSLDAAARISALERRELSHPAPIAASAPLPTRRP